ASMRPCAPPRGTLFRRAQSYRSPPAIDPAHGVSMPAFLRFAFLACAALLLSGCASVFLVDNQVESFPRWQDHGANTAVPAPPQIYRFDRLPSQQDERGARGQEELERYTEASLAKLGWTRAAPGVSAP